MGGWRERIDVDNSTARSQIKHRHRTPKEIRALRRARPAELRIRVVRVRMELVLTMLRMLQMLSVLRGRLQRLLLHLPLAPLLAPALLLLLLLLVLLVVVGVLVVLMVVVVVLFLFTFRGRRERRRRRHTRQDERGRHPRRAKHHPPPLRVLDALHPATHTSTSSRTLLPKHRTNRRGPERSAKVRLRAPGRVMAPLPARLARLAERADGHQVPPAHASAYSSTRTTGNTSGSIVRRGLSRRGGRRLGARVVEERSIEHVVELPDSARCFWVDQEGRRQVARR